MGGVKVGPPSPEEIRAHPREFALYTQLPGADAGTVAPEALQEFLKRYGNGSSNFTGGSFAEFASALKKTGPKVDWIEGAGNCLGYATPDDKGHLSPFKFERRPVGDDDVGIAVTYCGVCHSDLHQVKNEWGNSMFPMVPGHEVVGIVTEVGKNVTNFKLGDHAGVGCFVDACRDCRECSMEIDNYCTRCIMTYNGKDWRHGNKSTAGGYSTGIVVDHRYVLKVPKNLDMAAAAPLLCAGITTYSPMMYYNLNKAGMSMAVVGLGGLGHMAVKFGKAMGMDVTVISTSARKEKEAREVLGADHFIISKDEKQMQAAVRSFDGIIDTVSAQHDIGQLLPLLKVDGKLILLGVPPEPHTFSAGNVLFSRLTIGGSLIGGIKETQEMLDFCGEKNITCIIETVSADYVNQALDRLVKNDVHYRFVIDVQGTMLKEE